MSYIKDPKGFLINTNESHYKAILAQRESQKLVQAVDEQIKDLHAQLKEIKALMADASNGK